MTKERVMEEQAHTMPEPTIRADRSPRADRTTSYVSLASAGSVLAALKAISCPLILVLLYSGVGTAWIGDLSALAPYQPIFYGLAAAQLGFGYYLVYWKPRQACAEGAARSQPSPTRFAKYSLWGATALVATAIAFGYVAPPLFGIF